MTSYLILATLTNFDGVVADEYVNSFAFDTAQAQRPTPPPITDLLGAVNRFYQNIAPILCSEISQAANAHTLTAFDITAHLNGSPHGSPVATQTMTLTTGVSGFIPEQAALVLRHTAFIPAGLLERSATIDTTIPTDEEGQDEGAAVVHSGFDHPKARLRGRNYLGPLDATAISADSSRHRIASPAATAALTTAVASSTNNDPQSLLAATFTTPNGKNQSGWGVWSRRGGAVVLVANVACDKALGTVRRRRVQKLGTFPIY